MFKNKSNKADKAAKQPVFKQDYFENSNKTYSCIHCRAHLANHDELISKLFQGNHGRAYLFNKVVNIGCKQAVQRELLTGLHAVADIYCDSCETTLGWKYEQAFVPSQKYKEGKYIIELVHMLKENEWDLTSYNARELLEEANIPVGRKKFDYKRIANNFKVGDNCYWLKSGEKCESKDKSYVNGSRCVMPFDIRNEDQNVELGDQEKAEPLTTSNAGKETIEAEETAKQIPPLYVEGEEADEREKKIIANKDSEKSERSGRIEIISNDAVDYIERSSDRQPSLEIQRDNINKRSQNLLESAKDSFCSSRSQSDLSSCASATDSSLTDEQLYELSSSTNMMIPDGINTL